MVTQRGLGLEAALHSAAEETGSTRHVEVQREERVGKFVEVGTDGA